MSDQKENTLRRLDHPVPPTLVVSNSDEHDASTPTLARPKSRTEGTVSDNSGRQDAPAEWIDVDDDSPPRRRRRRSSYHTASKSHPRNTRSTENEVSRFFPKLARILESGESTVSRSGVKEPRRQRDRSSERYSSCKDDGKLARRSPIKHRVGGGRRLDTLPRFNPSLLSVLSSLTRTSDRSSSSSTTITQQSYLQGGAEGSKGKRPYRCSETEADATKEGRPLRYHALDFMDSELATVGHDGQSIYSNGSISSSSSATSSHYQASDAGSSELPETPSSQSTFPSPTTTRNSSLTGSVAELRRKYDAQRGEPVEFSRGGSDSPEATSRSQVKRSLQRRDDAEDGDSPPETSTPPYNEVVNDRRRRSESRSSRQHDERSKHRHDASRHHATPPSGQHGHHLVDPYYDQHRSHSASSTGSSESQRAWAHYLSNVAMQQYQHPSPPAPVAYPLPPQAMNGHTSDVPPAPDAPDLNVRTFAGYEMLANELAQTTSPIKPMYRKFEYLNHRILLHMQDELQEMEERLRTLDEIIAQMEPPSSERQPASRRGDAFQGTEMHYRRTQLLGRIFMKSEQYNRAMTSFATMAKECAAPGGEDIQSYRDWLKKKTPIHEVETKFLDSDSDLILSNKASASPSSTIAAHPGLHLLPLALLLPLLLFSIIPTLAGRLIVTVLVLVGAVLVAGTTRVGAMMTGREWAVCGAVYVLIAAAIAGCVPRYEIE